MFLSRNNLASAFLAKSKPSFFLPIETTQARNGATLKEIKNRMNTIVVIRKITSSMKSVASSRLKQAERRKDMVQPFARASIGLLANVPEPEDAERNMFLAITSDRGLCGSANSSIVKKIRKTAQKMDPNSFEVTVIGDKGRGGLMRTMKKNISIVVTKVDVKPVTFGDVMVLADYISKQKFDKLTIVSNKFVNSLTFETRELVVPSREILIKNASKSLKNVEVEDNEVLEDLYTFYLTSLIYTSVIENIACELSSRLNSMDNATRNAGDMLRTLSIFYNRKRQAVITSELTEIIAGASSIEEGVEY